VKRTAKQNGCCSLSSTAEQSLQIKGAQLLGPPKRRSAVIARRSTAIKQDSTGIALTIRHQAT
jgi:hypothetical protein